jgi:hypothetical protein
VNITIKKNGAMKFFSYNEKSFLQNGFIRKFNYIILGIILLLGIDNSTSFPLSCGMAILMAFSVSILSSIITYKVISDIEFYEWDYTERKKKFRFTLTFIPICVFMCSLFTSSIIIAYSAISSNYMPLIGNIIFILPILFFLFNLCNIISLYYPVFESDLTLGYKIQKKPNNWQDDGREIKNEDEIKEILHRDFGI